MAAIQQYLDQVMITIDRLVKGASPEDIGEMRMADVHRVEEWMGLKHGSLVNYAPRSRRRFFAAARQGYRPREAYAQERAARQVSTVTKWGLTPAQFRVVHRLMQQILDSGVDIEYYFDPPVIKEFATMYGYEYLVTVFTQQLDSIQHFIAGGYVRGSEPGHTRWDERGSIEGRFHQDFGASVFMIRGTDPYYYYHAAK